jgi:predicted nucleotidyltransferase
MTRDEALQDILEEAKQLARRFPKAAWYGFGSYFKGQDSFGDIDVLVVCATTTDTIFVRAETESICARWPLHLMIMTEDEQAETGFVASESCIMLHAATIEWE